MAIIATTLELIRGKLNDSIQNLDRRTEDWVILSNIVDVDGRPYETATNKIVMCLTSVVDEKMISTYNAMARGSGEEYARISPPLYVDLYIAFIANFCNQNYSDGLVALSRTISFFQSNPWFSHDNVPKLDPAIDKLNLEFVNLDPVDVNYIMGMLGIKYLPSVFYKLRLLPFTSNQMTAKAMPVGGYSTPSTPDSV